MLTHYELLNEVAKEKKHTFISTGMHTLEEIKKAINIFKKYNCPFELMHTVSTYPMKIENANLNMIHTLKKVFNCNVGYSGHEVGRAVSVAAAALGIGGVGPYEYSDLDYSNGTLAGQQTRDMWDALREFLL